MASDAMGVAFFNRRTPAKLSMGKSAKVVGATNLRQNNEGTGENCRIRGVTSPSGIQQMNQRWHASWKSMTMLSLHEFS
jgi:hypothetical protein